MRRTRRLWAIADPYCLTHRQLTHVGESILITGYWESARFRKDGLRIGGWAVDLEDSSGPEMFEFIWGPVRHAFTPSAMRRDIAQAHGIQLTLVAFDYLATDLPPLIGHDWPPPQIRASWANGSSYELAVLNNPKSNDFTKLVLGDFNHFQSFFQNPATRIDNHHVQAYAAAQALTSERPGSSYWMAAATLGLYRHLEDGSFPADRADHVLAAWSALNHGDAFAGVIGEEMRWVIAVNLACGYVYFARGDLISSFAAFERILVFRPVIDTWPQSITTMMIALFLCGWINWRNGERSMALKLLRQGPRLIQTHFSLSQNWSWYQFEESRVALNLAQQIFVLLKRIEAEQDGITWPSEAQPALDLAGFNSGGCEWVNSIIPGEAELSFGRVSMVLHRLAKRGIIAEGPFPDKPQTKWI